MNKIKIIIKKITFFLLICVLALSAVSLCYKIYMISADKRKNAAEIVLDNNPLSIKLTDEIDFTQFSKENIETLNIDGFYYIPEEQDTISNISAKFQYGYR